MISNKLTGSWVALVTPMLDNGDIDFERLRSLIDWHIESGTDGVVVMGTTGESATVSEQEYLAVIEASIQYANGRIPVVAGCGSSSTEKAVSFARKINPFKPDGFLCVTPYYVKPSQSGLVIHFETLADVCEAPVLLYNVPGRTGVDLADSSIIQLAKHENIVGIKDATGDLSRLEAIKDLSESFVLLSGDDETAFEFIQSGGHGVISVTANVFPEAMKKWIELIDKSEHKAKIIFDILLPVHKAMFLESNPIPVKSALSIKKRIENGIRLPLTRANHETYKVIENVLRECSFSQ
ncbi:4-hydroxy-tetrahydrodipicolinate synthase [Aliikangiella sp. G2MR2-5]|uniref:4-hydroxy-tetrahydrodipicolinate synthase n=1 Tax=Aliikangiella sp. G2MR2-5 TaxID=2788943 RepID=UPI0018A9A5C6|nr:4-hydroxy-tetrahydrodipicolinate synthase [Aliikangiella sp. G2MR2-5]